MNSFCIFIKTITKLIGYYKNYRNSYYYKTTDMEQNLSKKTRTESDLIGSREVPESALYGVQTLRGIENFRISKFHLNEYPLFIQALAITKMGAAVANR